MTPAQLPAYCFSITRDSRATWGTKRLTHYFVLVCGHVVSIFMIHQMIAMVAFLLRSTSKVFVILAHSLCKISLS